MSEAIAVNADNPSTGQLQSRIFTGTVGIRDHGSSLEIGFFGNLGRKPSLPERATLNGEVIVILSVAPRVPDNQAPTGMPRSYVMIAQWGASA